VDTARIAALLEPFLEQSPPKFQLDQISTYIDLLLHWNARINLTAIRHPEEIVTRHFGESLFMARHLFPTSSNPCHPDSELVEGEASVFSPVSSTPQEVLPALPGPRVLDIGSGAGFPALPLKIWAPNIQLTLIESNHKKAAFLREVSRALTLTDINVITDRAETLARCQDFPRADVVTLRAVERFDTILRQAAALLSPQATLALLIGTAQIRHLTILTTVKWRSPIPVPRSTQRVLSIGVQSSKWDYASR
jgi:16S rRNA (guanine527-N7)-methyltransferase